MGLCLSFAGFAAAAPAEDTGQLLLQADDAKTVNFAKFVEILHSIQQHPENLTASQHVYLRYLEAWKNAYDGDNETAIARLNALADEPIDVTLRLRAGATAVNVLELAKRYEEAFSRLSRILVLLPQVSDKAARQQALLDAAELYTDVGQYGLALSYAQTVIEEDTDGHGLCKGNRVKERALYESGRIKTVGSALQGSIDDCVKVGELGNAEVVRLTAARVFVDQGKLDEAIKLLRDHYEEVQATRNPRLLSTFDALLADAYRRKGVPALARQFALNVTGSPLREFNDPLVTAYRVLYEIAKDQVDFKAALEFHEQYFAADKAYLDDLSARHLAYQKVSHENIANKLQVDALNKQNHVLQLQRALSSKDVEASRLYIVLLIMTVVFIGLWAYKTKRSQLHFQTLSQLDGLTGICNRPHFIAQAERALEASRRTGEHLCMVLCDLDHFKSINDKYGHATGDFVLKRTVSACKVLLDKNEIFGRFGGEEFGVLLPACGPEDARQRAEQLRMTIAGITAYQGTTKATVSASFGIATTSHSGHDLGQLLAHADAALYEAKRAGRNRVVLFGQPSELTPLAIVAATGEFVQYAGRSSGG
ncbi:MAG: diguanylate cyclase protein [Gammaproteobacteria bacterium]|nr:diguanylate cyclase protein [Gammaproteobacteria bacterium]